MKIITPDENPFGRDNSVVDTRGAVLPDAVDVATLTNPSDGRTIYGLELAGKVNQATDRSDVLYLMDTDGAAAIVSELIGLFDRADYDACAEFHRLVDQRLAPLPKTDGGPRQ